MNRVPSRYREVAVAHIEGSLDERALRMHFLGRQAYRRTRYIVVRNAGHTAVVEVDKRSESALFSEITAMRLLAGPDETSFVHSPDTDVAVPSQLGRVAAERASTAGCVVVQGRHQHVSFILDPSPLRVHVVEVGPPWPPKLLDQARRVLDVADDLPPVELVPQVVDLVELAGEEPSAHYLLPCRGSGIEVDGAQVSFLDEIPARADWTLVGCARSRAIHRWFYGEDVPGVEMCPRKLVHRQRIPADAVALTKCCLREEGIEADGRVVVVPWGASLTEIHAGLVATVGLAADDVEADGL